MTKATPQDSPSRHQDQFIVRMPDGMRDRLAAAARAARRSTNSEIVRRLDLTFAMQAQALAREEPAAPVGAAPPERRCEITGHRLPDAALPRRRTVPLVNDVGEIVLLHMGSDGSACLTIGEYLLLRLAPHQRAALASALNGGAA